MVGQIPGSRLALILCLYQLTGIGSRDEVDGAGRGLAVSAEEAEQLGIVNRVLAENKLEEGTRALAVKVALGPPEVMRLTKLPINRTFEIMGLNEALSANIDLSSILKTAMSRS